MTQTVVSDRMAKFVLTVDRFALGVARHWLLYVNVVVGAFVLLPFAAPALMALGLTGPADLLYFIYGFFCHQLPQRSFFLFGHPGAKLSYDLEEIGQVISSVNLVTLRQFVGNPVLGWKVAWSDRMVAMFGSIWLGGLAFAFFRRFRPEKSYSPLVSPVAWLLLAIVPMGLDGLTHTVNDAFAGLSGTGFRDTNTWLQFLTGNALPASFYAGDAVGSFNNLARLATGTLFGFTTVLFLYPFIEFGMKDTERITHSRLNTPRAVELGFATSSERAPMHEIHLDRAGPAALDESGGT